MRALILAAAMGCAMTSVPLQQAVAEKALQPANFSDLAEWRGAGHAEAYRSLALSCAEITGNPGRFKSKRRFAGRAADWSAMCKTVSRKPRLPAETARRFFEKHFQVFRVVPETGRKGLFTGYYEPEVKGSRTRTASFPVPIYAKPDDLVTFNKAERTATGLRYGRRVAGKPKPYFTRKQIEQGALRGRGLELVWLSSWADAFFMQVQGSGRVRLPDGSAFRLGYAGKTGLPYTAIGAVLIKTGDVAREDMSMQAIRAWMTANPKKARALMWHNESFVFFRPVTLVDETLGPIGAQQVQLQPEVSLAVDRSLWAYGTPVFLETTLPATDDTAERPFNRLMIAQDTGTAIKGRVRGDIFFGAGERAARLAGRMQSPGNMFVLLPHAVARRLGLGK